MKTKTMQCLIISAVSLVACLLWTIAVKTVDVCPIGPRGSSVGLAALNGAFHRLTGVHMTLYHITDWLGLVPFTIAFCFAMLGLVQWIRRRKLTAVDRDLFVLGGFYLAVIAAYLLFEELSINYRPVLIAGFLEASYPSSTTLLVMCVMPTTAMQMERRIQNARRQLCVRWVIVAFTVFVVTGRLFSGVHWLSDIIGGGLLSAGLVMLYRALCDIGRN